MPNSTITLEITITTAELVPAHFAQEFSEEFKKDNSSGDESTISSLSPVSKLNLS